MKTTVPIFSEKTIRGNGAVDRSIKIYIYTYKHIIVLGGGFKHFLFSIFTPKIGEGSHFDPYFSKGLVQPPTSLPTVHLYIIIMMI